MDLLRAGCLTQTAFRAVFGPVFIFHRCAPVPTDLSFIPVYSIRIPGLEIVRDINAKRAGHTIPASGASVIDTGRKGLPHLFNPVSYTHLRAHETRHDLVCRLLLEKKK